jgi:two-component system, OmpR family, phosphate regulon sensor histidine kinase PhoR
MWEFLTFAALAGGIGLHLGWRRRYARARAELTQATREAAVVQDAQRRSALRQQTSTQTLLNRMAEGILLLDPAGRVQFVNPSLERMFGVSGDVREKTVLEAFRSAELSALADQLARGGTVLDHELNLPGLEPRCVQVNAVALMNEEGRPEGRVLVLHDLTRLKRLEHTRQEFVANVSHELRTPLSLIKGCVETLLDGAKDDPEVLNRFLHTIEKHADRLTYLIEDLLTLSQLESGRIALNLRSTQLREVVTRVVEDLQARARLKSMSVDNTVPPDLFAHADGERLEQVLFNLVDNAIKYGKTGGRTIIGGREGADGWVEVSVTDDGPGIPQEARERVFERFYRVDRARSREQGGTGLGLAIVKHIVQCHDGEVRLESEAGRGTTFCFTLPSRGH